MWGEGWKKARISFLSPSVLKSQGGRNNDIPKDSQKRRFSIYFSFVCVVGMCTCLHVHNDTCAASNVYACVSREGLRLTRGVFLQHSCFSLRKGLSSNPRVHLVAILSLFWDLYLLLPRLELPDFHVHTIFTWVLENPNLGQML